MSPTLGGPPFCPKCGYQDASAPAADSELESHTMLYDASEFGLFGGSSDDGTATKVMKAARPPSRKRPAKGRRVPGESIFDTDLRVEPGSGDRTPGTRVHVAGGGRAPLVDQESATADLPRVSAPEDEPGGRRAARGADGVRPLREEALFLPRCKYCERPLELEEVARGVCGKCLRERSRWRRGVTAARVAQVTAGTLATCAVIWIGALVLLATARAGPSIWRTPAIVTPSLRLGLVVFAGAAAVAFARGRDWGAGAAVALGPAVVGLTAFQLRSGALVGELASSGLVGAAAWLGAGAAGALVTVVALTCFGSGNVLSEASLLADSRRRRSGRKAKIAGSPPRRTPSARTSDGQEPGGREGNGDTWAGRGRAITGGAVALAGAGLAGWLAVLAAGGSARLSPETFPSIARDTPLVSAIVLGVAAVAAAALGVWLIVKPPAEETHSAAVAGAAIAGALPAWMLFGAFLRGAQPVRALVIVSGTILLVGAESMAVIPCAMSPEILAVGVVGTVAALTGSLWTLFGTSPMRGRALAGFALAWAFVWGSGLAAAVAAG